MNRTLAVVIAVTLASPSAQSQTAPPSNRRVPSVDSATGAKVRDYGYGAVVRKSSAIDDMKAALRDLVTAQETYFVDHDTYTTDGQALNIFPPHGQVQTHVTYAGGSSWTGLATEPSLKGKDCVIYVGFVKNLPNGPPKTMGGAVAKKEGVPVCDEP